MHRKSRAYWGGSGASGVPPRRPGSFDRFPDEPPESDRASYDAYWRRRQNALGAGDLRELLQRHEIVFYEQFRDAGNRFTLIPRDHLTFRSTHDFEWHNPRGNHVHGNLSRRGELVELKSFEKPRRKNVAAEIHRTAVAARAHQVTKDVFIVHSRKHPPTPAFLRQMADYNVEHAGAQIRQLFWWTGTALQEIELR